MRLLVLGTFDLFHVGHLNMLQSAAMYGELYVGVNTDRFAAQYKRAPVIGENERLRVVSGLRCVHAAHLNDGPGRDLIDKLRPNVVVTDTDWHRTGRYLQQVGVSEEWLEERNIGVMYLPRTGGVSTSQIIDGLRAC